MPVKQTSVADNRQKHRAHPLGRLHKVIHQTAQFKVCTYWRGVKPNCWRKRDEKRATD